VRSAVLEEYNFVAALTQRPVKVTIIGPDRLAARFDVENSRSFYPGGVEEFLDDVVGIERQMIRDLHAAGCRYVQLDSSPYTAYADPTSLAEMRARGEDPDAKMQRAIAVDNSVMASFPDMTFGMHLCRGNKRGHYHREGKYDEIAERLFNTLACDRILLEYDDERSGGFEPLRFVPKGKIVVLGLITTKHGEVESVDELRHRIDEAAKYLDLEQLALSPQCGFASALAGNALSEEAQWRKIDVMLETVRAVWGSR
jgi:5-methyltetrahydropteroyltriglutamate--homocysteine methyltransferase